MDNSTFHNNAHLSFEELSEYNKGNLSNAEMHRLELHLISCDLCKDALEGMQLIEDEQAVKSIARVVEANRLKEESNFGLYHYIGIAASVILFTVVGNFFMRSDNQNELALADQEPQLIEQLRDEVEDVVSNETPLDSTDISSDTGQLALTEPDIQLSTEQPEQPEQEFIARTEPEVAKATTVPSSDIANAETGQTLAEIGDTSLNEERIVNPDSISVAVIPKDEETGSMAKRAAVPQENTPSLASESIDSPALLELVKAEPPKGTRAFNRYLRRNTNYPDTANENGIEGDVDLSVIINSDGSIAEIIVIKSLGYGCDEEAIRLIREGGDWTPATRGEQSVTDTVNVTISFKP